MNYVTHIENCHCENLDQIFRLFIEPWKDSACMFNIFELALRLSPQTDPIEWHVIEVKTDSHVIFLAFALQ